MKTCKRCGYCGEGHFHFVIDFDLCPDCYEAWATLERHIFRQFIGEKLRIEEERKIVI